MYLHFRIKSTNTNLHLSGYYGNSDEIQGQIKSQTVLYNENGFLTLFSELHGNRKSFKFRFRSHFCWRLVILTFRVYEKYFEKVKETVGEKITE